MAIAPVVILMIRGLFCAFKSNQVIDIFNLWASFLKRHKLVFFDLKSFKQDWFKINIRICGFIILLFSFFVFFD